MALTILIAEDEKSISSVLKLNLELEGFKVLLAETGNEAIEIIKNQHDVISLALVDIMMPEKDGFEVCAFIKQTDPEIPVIFLTAKGASEDRVKGLKTGADDYLVKPFNLEELLLRMNNILKLYQKDKLKDNSVFVFGRNSINFSNWEIKGMNGQTHTLGKREMELLKLLVDKKHEVVSRDLILEKLWEADENPSSRTIDNLILNFRKYFEKNPRDPKFFHSIRGVGYKFTP